MPTYLVTGGAGFIGSHIVSALTQRGGSVRVLDNLSSGSLENLKGVEQAAEFIQGDIRDADHVWEAVAGVDVISHRAALVSVAQSAQQPLLTEDINVVGTLVLLAAARNAGVRRVVYASSAAVYRVLTV